MSVTDVFAMAADPDPALLEDADDEFDVPDFLR